ncbi:hypothetical protein C8J57DRAFT_1400321 [Mycena rebaudengoi]|nr:hypothetical protein C8J57DRAFT_1400321 [Mycena rebaudengoi]
MKEHAAVFINSVPRPSERTAFGITRSLDHLFSAFCGRAFNLFHKPPRPPTKMQFTTLHGLSSSTFKPPPLDGSLLLPDVFDYHSRHSPNHPLFVYVGDVGVSTAITWSQAVDAFRRAAHVSQAQVEVDGPEAPVVAILAATNQITYLSAIAGIILAGYLPFPISPRNSVAAVVNLLQSSSCKHVYASADPSMQKLAQTVQVEITTLGGDLKIMPIPTFQELFEPTGASQTPISSKRVQLDDAAVIMHSSGSTAFPKAITLTHRILWESGLTPYYGEVDLCGEILSIHSVPMFHMLGLVQLPYTAFTGMTLSSYSPALPPMAPSPDTAFEGAMATKSTLMICAPAFLESWARDSAHVNAMQKLITIIFGGGPLQTSVGDDLVHNGVHISHLYGLTEGNCLSRIIPKSVPTNGWDYFPLSPHTDPALVPVEGSPGVYQVYFKKCATHTPAILDAMIDGVPALNTKDLIVRHPKDPKLWKIFGRQDDQLMHSNGEKTNPVPIEKILHENAAIKHAIMFGRGKFHAGVLIFPEEPFDPADEQLLIEFRRSIWPTVERANQLAPTHSRIFKEMILVANPSKTIELTAKGTPRRQAVLNSYADEIRDIYLTVEESFQKHLTTPIEFNVASSLEFVRKIVGEVMVELPGDDDDIFQNGCDSLQATWIRNSILHALINSQKIDPKMIPSNFVYSHPTVQMLADMLTKLAEGGASNLGEISRRADAMRAMVQKYTQGFPQHMATAGAPQTQAVLVTGTTGALGRHILAHLLAFPQISVVYAFNRPHSNLRERQFASFKENGIDTRLLDSPKLKLLAGNLNAPQFGLSHGDYDTMRDNVTLIVHNAWQVNFSMALSSMEPLVAGTRQLINFALASPHPSPPRLVFVSTAAVFRNLDGSEPALERPISDPRVSVGLGYSESKWVAERLLEAAAEMTILLPVIIRPGQLSAPANGAWNVNEWFPVLLRSSQLSGKLPIISGQITWVPVDRAAKAVLEMHGSQERYAHIIHPHPVPMTHILSPVSRILDIPLVPYSDWLESLDKTASHESEASANPAVRLIDFFRTYREVAPDQEAFFPAVLSTTVSIRTAPSLASAAALTAQDVEVWTAYLRQGGYLA